MINWAEFKRQFEPGSVLDLVVERKVPPGFLFFKFSDDIQGSLHVSELNWNFGLSQTDFRNIPVGSTLRVYVIGFDDRYKKVHLSRKLLPTIERPSKSTAWKNLSLQKEIPATVFEEYRNKVIVQLDSGLFATIPLLESKSYSLGEKVQVIPVRKNFDLNIIECTLREVAASAQEQTIEVIESFKEQTTSNTFLLADCTEEKKESPVDTIIEGKDTSYVRHVSVSMDSRYVAKYKVLKLINGSYRQDTIEFLVFDHYGEPSFSKYKTVLLFVSYYKGKLYHEKYQYFDLYLTTDNKWASPYSSGDYNHPFKDKITVKPEKISFKEEISFPIDKFSSDEIQTWFPKPYYDIRNGKAIAIYGNYVDDLFKLKQQTILKARGIY